MSLLIKNLFELNLLNGAVLVAGKNGINREITWVIIMEILDEMNNLEKGELLLTTGYMLDNESLHENLIGTLHSKGIPGLVIQSGYYLNEIPKYIIDAGNEYNFPIIEIPKHISFSGIMQRIFKNLYNINFCSNSNKTKYLLQDLSIGKNPDSQEKLEIIKQLDLNTNSYLCIFILSATNTDNSIVSEDSMLHIICQLHNYFNSQNILAICENFNNKIFFLVSSKEKLSTQRLTTDLSEVLSKLYEALPDVRLITGGSNIFNDINHLLAAYEEACTSHSALKEMKAQKGICFYSYLTLFKSLSLINSNRSAANSLYSEIESLINYDKAHQSNYFDTLKTFLDNGCNINITSEKLYIHRHTLRNRLQKIRELSHIDFNDNYSKLSFSIAIYLYNFF